MLLECKTRVYILDQRVFMCDLSASLPDRILGLVENRVGRLVWVRHNDRLLNVHGNGARKERQSGKEEGEKSHGWCGERY